MHPQDWQAIWLSVKVGLLCVLVITLPGISLGWLLARKNFRGKLLFESLLYMPLVLPPVVTGYLMLAVLGKQGWVGSLLFRGFGMSLAFNFWGVVLVASVVAFPLMVRSSKLGFELADHRLDIAATTLGASPLRVFRKVTLPLAMPGIVTGLVLAFIRSIGEFGATITFAGNIEGETRTLPLAVYTYLQMPGREAAVWTLSLVAVVLSVIALVMSEWMNRKLHMRMRGRSELGI